MYAKDLPPVARRSLLSRLFWIHRLKPPVQRELYRLASTDAGWVELRKIFISCEMRTNSVILADPTAPTEFFDQVNASLISNSLNQKNFHKFLKAVVKKCRKAILTGAEVEIPRSCSWLSRVINRVKGNVEERVQQLTLLQTRASGYPSDEIRKESLEKWIDTVTGEVDPDPEALSRLSELEAYLKEVLAVNAFTVRNTHVSLGASACLENPRARGGKTSLARELLSKPQDVYRIDLATGEYTDELILADEEPGEYLFHLSLSRVKEAREQTLSVRVGTIDEVGEKSRIITIPSFHHSTVLSPWAHLTYQALKTCRETSSGVSGTNHAWELSLSLSASDPDLEWLFAPRGEIKAFNSDLSEATDRAYHDAIRCVVDCMQAVMPVQPWYHSVVRDLLSSSRPFSVRMENEILRGVSARGCFMGDHGSKTVLTLSGMYALAGMRFPRLSRIVGDDHTTVSANAEEAGKIYRSRIESLGYMLSEDDSFESRTIFFAEEASEIPTSASHTTEVWMSRKGRSRLPFVDVPKVKILSDAGKTAGLFSETAIGKITLLGQRMEATGKTFREGLFHLASWIQDICISLVFRKEFVYFPRFLVQTGKPILFGHPENAHAFFKMQRRGRMKSHYADIMEQALRPSTVRDSGKYIIQSFFTHGANDDQIRIVEREFPLHEFEDDRLLTEESMKGFEPFLVSRLRSKVISESEIVAKLAERSQLLSDPPATKRLTVANLARGGRELTDDLLTEFTGLWESNSKLLRIRKGEKYYDRKAVEEKLGCTHPLRVSGILQPLPLLEGAEIRRTERDREVEKLYTWVKSNPQRLDDIPRALIRDDLVLLSDAYLTVPRLLIVTDDIKLLRASAILRSFNWRQSRETFHISVNDWVLSDLTAGDSFEPSEVFIDEGALDGYLDNLDKEGREPPDPDGGSIVGRFRPIRPTGKLTLPTEVMELRHLRGELPSVAE